MRYPFVLFDVGATLIGPRESFGAIYRRELSSFGFDLPAAAFDRSLMLALEEMERTVPKGANRFSFFPGGEEGYWLRFAKLALEDALGKPLDERLAERTLAVLRAAFRRPEAWVIFPDVLPALEQLRGSGARLGIVSNWDSLLPELLEGLGLSRYFEAVAVSHLEDVEKPEPALFEVALEKLGAPPERTLHVGDLPEMDLEGARAAGVDAVLIDRRGRLDPSLGAIRDLAPLPGFVARGLPGERSWG